MTKKDKEELIKVLRKLPPSLLIKYGRILKNEHNYAYRSP